MNECDKANMNDATAAVMMMICSHPVQFGTTNKPFSFRTYGRVSKRSLNDDRRQQHIDNIDNDEINSKSCSLIFLHATNEK